MLVRNPNLFANIDMALKYFGFPYDKNVNFKLPKQSPSHTVGLELPQLRDVSDLEIIKAMSPSHTVGLELVCGCVGFDGDDESPSHTVGLEHLC